MSSAPTEDDLFAAAPDPHAPLAARLRPTSLDTFFGQTHLLGPDRPLRQLVNQGSLHAMLLWGPPGTGKTTLAKLLALRAGAAWISLSAVLGGVKEVRAAIEQARHNQQRGLRTVLFIDEIHRFNKAQQDAFLPHVEAGTVILIGATTENPSFEVNNALLSRLRVYVLQPLDAAALTAILGRALTDTALGLGQQQLRIAADAQALLLAVADGDARRLLNLLDLAAQLCPQGGEISARMVQDVAGQRLRAFDDKGEQFYDQISVLHKAVRGSAPDAALYWLCRMLDGGCDPLYIARRLVRMATEDIGNADPRALQMALAAWDSYHRLGSPEGELAIAQAVLYLACVPKSNAVYQAFNAAKAEVATTGTLAVPLRFRNAVTGLMRELDYGSGYRYAHDEADAYAPGERYFPDEMADVSFYQPAPRGLEQRIAEYLARLRAADAAGAKPPGS